MRVTKNQIMKDCSLYAPKQLPYLWDELAKVGFDKVDYEPYALTFTNADGREVVTKMFPDEDVKHDNMFGGGSIDGLMEPYLEYYKKPEWGWAKPLLLLKNIRLASKADIDQAVETLKAADEKYARYKAKRASKKESNIRSMVESCLNKTVKKEEVSTADKLVLLDKLLKELGSDGQAHSKIARMQMLCDASGVPYRR